MIAMQAIGSQWRIRVSDQKSGSHETGQPSVAKASTAVVKPARDRRRIDGADLARRRNGLNVATVFITVPFADFDIAGDCDGLAGAGRSFRYGNSAGQNDHRDGEGISRHCGAPGSIFVELSKP